MAEARMPVFEANFLDNVFRVLLHARRILSASYCIGYFVPEDNTSALNAHEALQVSSMAGFVSAVMHVNTIPVHMSKHAQELAHNYNVHTHTHTHTHTHNHQAKLEEAVEILSEMVNRQYLRTPQSQMGEAARNVDCLCNEYLSEMKEVANIAYCALIAEQRRKQMVDEPPPKPPRANPAFPHSTERPQANTRVPEDDLLRNLENFVMFVDPDTGRLHIYMGEGITIPVDVLFNRQGEEEDV